MLFEGSHGCLTRLRFSHDLNVGEGMQIRTYALTYDFVVIYEEDFDWHKIFYHKGHKVAQKGFIGLLCALSI